MIGSVFFFLWKSLQGASHVKWLFIKTFGLIFLSSLASVFGVWVFKDAINSLLSTDTLSNNAYFLLISYLVFQVASRFLSAYSFLTYGKFEQNGQQVLGRVIFSKLHQLSLATYLKEKAGSLAYIVDHGFSGFRGFFFQFFTGILPLAFDITFIIGALTLIYGPIFGGIALAFGALSFFLTFLFSKTIDQEQKNYMSHIQKAFGNCFDSLMNYEMVKCFTAERHVENNFLQELSKLKTSALRAISSTTSLSYAQAILLALVLSAFLFALHHAFPGDVGGFVMVVLFMLQLSGPLANSSHHIRSMRNGYLELQALLNILNSQDVLEEKEQAQSLNSLQSLSLKRVSFASGTQHILNQITFSLKRGEHIAIVGGSGAGKTTLIRLFFRLYDVTSGEILINDVNIKNYKLLELRKSIAVVPQDTILFHDTIYNNIAFGDQRATLQEVQKAAQRAGIHTFIQSLPQGYETVVGERGMKLSGGERQRIAIARALLKDPDLFIFDEATSSLDPQTEAHIQENLRELTALKTAIFIAHRLWTIKDVNRIYVLEKGQIQEEGTHQELLLKGGIYKNLWDLQQQNSPHD